MLEAHLPGFRKETQSLQYSPSSSSCPPPSSSLSSFSSNNTSPTTLKIESPNDLLQYAHARDEVIDLTLDDVSIHNTHPHIEVINEDSMSSEEDEEEKLERRLTELRKKRAIQSKKMSISFDKLSLNF